MAENYEFDDVTFLRPMSMGVPGKRTFFLIIGEKDDWVRVWLEKEQLQALGLAVDQLRYTLAKERIAFPKKSEGEAVSVETPQGMPAAEVEIEQITLGYDEGKVEMKFLVHPVGPQMEESSEELTCRATLAQLMALGEEAKAICSAGRPRCILCGGPIDPEGHNCPMNN